MTCPSLLRTLIFSAVLLSASAATAQHLPSWDDLLLVPESATLPASTELQSSMSLIPGDLMLSLRHWADTEGWTLIPRDSETACKTYLVPAPYQIAAGTDQQLLSALTSLYPLRIEAYEGNRVITVQQPPSHFNCTP